MCGMDYRFTNYFENEVLRKRPYLKKEWCVRVCENPIKSEPQEHNRFRYWGEIEELGGQVLRVITLEDRKTEGQYTTYFRIGDSSDETELL
jgi:hypothetical protein